MGTGGGSPGRLAPPLLVSSDIPRWAWRENEARKGGARRPAEPPTGRIPYCDYGRNGFVPTAITISIVCLFTAYIDEISRTKISVNPDSAKRSGMSRRGRERRWRRAFRGRVRRAAQARRALGRMHGRVAQPRGRAPPEASHGVPASPEQPTSRAASASRRESRWKRALGRRTRKKGSCREARPTGQRTLNTSPERMRTIPATLGAVQRSCSRNTPSRRPKRRPICRKACTKETLVTKFIAMRTSP